MARLRRTIKNWFYIFRAAPQNIKPTKATAVQSTVFTFVGFDQF